ncbi:hypothetical protein KBY96_11780 [Cyanobium sp. ATX 6A2]|uniref:hypothetical protein n=1 Tax=Cyanobium sp. ATX 6A2 TaxID=2823700 RepID=UPI0020CE41FA|nr:hypothetical protein [Cyanobium sp. ATX 6A2]MCP9888602.1 hypothetical protein [Cyanobium sp. ATX 6A2]
MAALAAAVVPLLRLLVLPLRAPLVLLLVAVAAYIGTSWRVLPGAGLLAVLGWFGSFDALQTLLVVVVCSMPLRLLRGVTGLMAASQVMTLVLTLLIVTVAAIYLLRLEVLSRVLILGSAVLLARVDLARIRVVPPPLQLSLGLSGLVLASCALGRWLISRG